MLLSLLLACEQAPDVPAADAACTIAPTSAEAAAGEAGNRVAWSLSGGAATVTAVASWYAGGVVATTTYDLSEDDTVEGVVSYLPYATGLDLQQIHGADIALTLTARDADGQTRCSWSDSVPFFTADWSAKVREMGSFSVSAPAALDESLADSYLLAPQSVSGGLQVMLYSTVGDVVGSYGLDNNESSPQEQDDLRLSGADLRKGQVHLLTDGVPGLTTSAHCRFQAESALLEGCLQTDALLHHGLFVSDSGTAAFSSQWLEDEDGPTAISLPTVRSLTEPGEPEVILDIAELLDAQANYENSFTRSPAGADGMSAVCSTDHLSFPVKETTQDIELGFCFAFDGEEVILDQQDIIVSDAYAQMVFEQLDGADVPLRVLPGHDVGIASTDFLHDLKRVRLADRHRVFVYNLGHFDPVRVNVFDFPDGGETTLRCTAELPDDDGTLFYGSVVLPRADSSVFGAFAATSAMDLRWYDVDTCEEVAAMLSAEDVGSGQWMTPVAASDLYAPGEHGAATVVSHQVTYSTATWSAD